MRGGYEMTTWQRLKYIICGLLISVVLMILYVEIHMNNPRPMNVENPRPMNVHLLLDNDPRFEQGRPRLGPTELDLKRIVGNNDILNYDILNYQRSDRLQKSTFPASSISRKQPTGKPKQNIKILWWTQVYMVPFEHDNNEFSKCPIPNCNFVSGRQQYRKADAVFFHFWKKDLFLDDMPKSRSPKQLWATFNQEPPAMFATTTAKFSDYRYAFNITFSYRLDSDIALPYGAYHRYPNPISLPTDDFAKGKTKLVAWMVSHCWDSNGRFHLAASLMKHISLDVYGKCGTMKCKGETEHNRNLRCLDDLG
jgi:hypothetical protein